MKKPINSGRDFTSETARIAVQISNEKQKIYRKERAMLKEKLKEKLLEVDKKNKASLDEITDALITQAKMGNVKAYEVIRDTCGEKPTENISAQIDTPTFVKDYK